MKGRGCRTIHLCQMHLSIPASKSRDFFMCELSAFCQNDFSYSKSFFFFTVSYICGTVVVFWKCLLMYMGMGLALDKRQVRLREKVEVVCLMYVVVSSSVLEMQSPNAQENWYTPLVWPQSAGAVKYIDCISAEGKPPQPMSRIWH